MPVYSHSRLSVYETCPRQYRFQFLDRLRQPPSGPAPEKDEDDDTPPRQKKGNPRRLPKKARAAARVLRHLNQPR